MRSIKLLVIFLFITGTSFARLPGIRLAYSAKTLTSTYCLKGFLLTDVND